MGTAPLPEGEPPARPARPPARGTPLPVPELPVPELGVPELGVPELGVPTRQAPPDSRATDDDRQRFGVLLDRALERGLLDPVEYQRRLGALAEATTVEELRDLVTELPVLRAGLDRRPTARPRPGGLAALGRPRYGATATAHRSPWPALVVVLVVLAVLVAVLAVVGAHLARSHQGSAPSAGTSAPLAAAAVPAGPLQGAPTVLSPSHL